MKNKGLSEEIVQEAQSVKRDPLDFVEEELFKAFDTSYELYRDGESEQRSNIALYERSLGTVRSISEAYQEMNDDELENAMNVTRPEDTQIEISSYPSKVVQTVDALSDDEIDFLLEEIFKSFDRAYESFSDGLDVEKELVLYNQAMNIVTAFQNLHQILEYQRIQQAKEIQDMLRDT